MGHQNDQRRDKPHRPLRDEKVRIFRTDARDKLIRGIQKILKETTLTVLITKDHQMALSNSLEFYRK